MKERVLCFLLLILPLWSCSAWAESAVTSLEQLNAPGITIGVGQGDIAELVVKNELPLATISYFDDKFMGYTAVAQGKIDALPMTGGRWSCPSRTGRRAFICWRKP